MIDVPEIRRRVRQTLEHAKQSAAARRARVDAAELEYARFLHEIAEPVVRQFAAAIKAEGFSFRIDTPSGVLRLESERFREDCIEFALASEETPVVVGRASRGRGRRHIEIERPLRDGAEVSALTEEDVLQFLLSEIPPLVTR